MTLKLNEITYIFWTCITMPKKLLGKAIRKVQLEMKKYGNSSKVKCHQLPTTSIVHYETILNWSVVSEILCGQSHRQTHRRRQKQYLLAACAQVSSYYQYAYNCFTPSWISSLRNWERLLWREEFFNYRCTKTAQGKYYGFAAACCPKFELAQLKRLKKCLHSAPAVL